ncbi:FecR family protein [Albibacterium profundi]|uniref:FecR domain-containing protein n=1 Tax=Albibacterium profundi TaxID=3134906 RepID=A0ABV5CCR6_9SPHI
MTKERLSYLIDICKTPRATSSEREELDQWYKHFGRKRDFLDGFNELEQTNIRSRIWRELISRPELASLNNGQKRKHTEWRWTLKVAVIAIAVLSLGLFLYLQQSIDLGSDEMVKNEIVVSPGGNKAILTLENGTKIDLKTIAVGEAIQEEGFKVVKNEDGAISYTVLDHVLGQEDAPFNTMSTPRGGQFKVTLPDGSLVWLNSASSIRYQTSFDDNERVVYLTGEAYFEIKPQLSANGKKKVPFIVSTANQEIEVLGTHFNVTAYEDDASTQTTLLEGKVRLTAIADDLSKVERILNVGETVRWDRNEFIDEQIPADKAVAWTKGKFVFTGENITEIMKRIGRWYDVNVVYNGNMKGVNFTGSLSQYDNIDKVLEKLALTGIVRFEVNEVKKANGLERRVTVMR